LQKGRWGTGYVWRGDINVHLEEVKTDNVRKRSRLKAIGRSLMRMQGKNVRRCAVECAQGGREGNGRCMGSVLPGNKLTARCMVALDVWSDFVECDEIYRCFTILSDRNGETAMPIYRENFVIQYFF